ncbi:hypothetical protein RQN30_05390 [Arcanobacterium hippocoleae]
MARTSAAIITVGSDFVCAGHRLTITTALPSLIKIAYFATSYVKKYPFRHQLRKLTHISPQLRQSESIRRQPHNPARQNIRKVELNTKTNLMISAKSAQSAPHHQ